MLEMCMAHIMQACADTAVGTLGDGGDLYKPPSPRGLHDARGPALAFETRFLKNIPRPPRTAEMPN